MPDPTIDLADIIEPAIPTTAAVNGDWVVIVVALLLGLAIIGGLYWLWRRRAPLRALQRLRSLPEPQRAADRLATLLPHFKCHPEQAWLDDLARLRFGPPQDDAQAVLDRLSLQAETLLQRQP